ncbi:glycosyltransferase [Lentisphaera profundi]|uniref:Glycosyltransferase n=1 Tax=Lentisphaera profundi TaxID=1658616 RepID=A0ABY7VZ17_9BACT|nr:glycosyltransferase [Lentisphaera profundi]WDE98455.1 glycosyltransferase [Lentisphaera profundi]
MKKPSISIVIPALNEAANISNICACLKAQTYAAVEVIIVDGGSTDKTQELFEKEGMRVLSGPRGRGNQIHLGSLKAKGDIIFVMHADMTLDSQVLEKIASAFSKDDLLIGGCVGSAFDQDFFKFRFLSWLNNLRITLTGISFGDQGQFFLRQRGLDESWIQAIPLMEDVELALRMKAAGKTIQLNGGIIASTRRWQHRSVLFNAIYVSYLLSKYLFLRRFKKDFSVEKFYESYYKK